MAHKILIVDDDPVNIALIKFGLAERRYIMSTAVDGQEGLEKVATEKPDLIILDVHMPNMSGYEFMGELKRIQGSLTTPVIMLTANETMESIFKLEGVKDYFVKPIQLLELMNAIVKCIGPNPIT